MGQRRSDQTPRDPNHRRPLSCCRAYNPDLNRRDKLLPSLPGSSTPRGSPAQHLQEGGQGSSVIPEILYIIHAKNNWTNGVSYKPLQKVWAMLVAFAFSREELARVSKAS
jgi:hypothetical protein